MWLQVNWTRHAILSLSLSLSLSLFEKKANFKNWPLNYSLEKTYFFLYFSFDDKERKRRNKIKRFREIKFSSDPSMMMMTIIKPWRKRKHRLLKQNQRKKLKNKVTESRKSKRKIEEKETEIERIERIGKLKTRANCCLPVIK